eukprot:scaffold300074_cov33-Tisochrysis_lutea.AAC.3
MTTKHWIRTFQEALMHRGDHDTPHRPSLSLNAGDERIGQAILQRSTTARLRGCGEDIVTTARATDRSLPLASTLGTDPSSWRPGCSKEWPHSSRGPALQACVAPATPPSPIYPSSPRRPPPHLRRSSPPWAAGAARPFAVGTLGALQATHPKLLRNGLPSRHSRALAEEHERCDGIPTPRRSNRAEARPPRCFPCAFRPRRARAPLRPLPCPLYPRSASRSSRSKHHLEPLTAWVETRSSLQATLSAAPGRASEVAKTMSAEQPAHPPGTRRYGLPRSPHRRNHQRVAAAPCAGTQNQV